MIKNVWLTKLEHFGGYDLTVITETEAEGIKALRAEFNEANKQRGPQGSSSYTFKELLDGGDVQQVQLTIGEVQWL